MDLQPRVNTKLCDRSADTSGTGNGKPEYIVNEQKARARRPCSRKYSPSSDRKAPTHSGSRRLIHLSENHGGLVYNPGFLHFIIKVISFSGPLTYAGEYGVSAVLCGDVTDQLLDQNCLSNAGASEKTILPPF